MRRFALVMSLLLAGLCAASPMVAQTCAPPECVGPVAAPDALFAPALREARGRSWRASGRRGPPHRGGRARWASPPVATGPGTGLGVIALEGLRGSRRPGASAWVAFERPDGWHACEAASRPGTRSAVRVDSEEPEVTRLFEQGPPGVTVALHFSEGWRERRFDYTVWHEHVAACVLGGDVPACFGSIETESGWSESDGKGSERLVERVDASFDGLGHVDVEAGWGQESIAEGDPSIFDQVGRHDVRSLGCSLPSRGSGL